MEDFCGLDVSRETIERLRMFTELLLKWNKRINLIARSTTADAWNRHIQDSAQIMQFVSSGVVQWVDVGSGGGLPGVVVATILAEMQPKARMTLIESDQRKSVFLRTAIRELDLNANVIAQRAEKTESVSADVFSARALMPLGGLIDLFLHHTEPDAQMLVLKGRTAQEEIDFAQKQWNFDVVAHQSITDNEAKILDIRNVRRAHA